jgi:hypothetical protein
MNMCRICGRFPCMHTTTGGNLPGVEFYPTNTPPINSPGICTNHCWHTTHNGNKICCHCGTKRDAEDHGPYKPFCEHQSPTAAEEYKSTNTIDAFGSPGCNGL